MRAGGPRRESLDNVQYGLHYGDRRARTRIPRTSTASRSGCRGSTVATSDQTHWAQLLTPMEGKKFGWYTLPDIDDVVVVMFIAGDISQPVIIGGVWSKPDSSPEPNEDGKNNFRGYRSRSGHRLILDDSEKTKVVFADKTTKNMIGIGEFAKDGAGPNVCAVYKPPMSGDERRLVLVDGRQDRDHLQGRQAQGRRPSRTSRSTRRRRSTSRPAATSRSRAARRRS